jgi:hypothetical protein
LVIRDQDGSDDLRLLHGVTIPPRSIAEMSVPSRSDIFDGVTERRGKGSHLVGRNIDVADSIDQKQIFLLHLIR